MSSAVTSRPPLRRSGCSASAMVFSLGSGIDFGDLQKRIYAVLDRSCQCALVADDPAMVVHAADGIGLLVVARLDVEQVVLQRLRQYTGVREQQQRPVLAGG